MYITILRISLSYSAETKTVSPHPVEDGDYVLATNTRPKLKIEIPETSPHYLITNQSQEGSQADQASFYPLPPIFKTLAIGELRSFEHVLPLFLTWRPANNPPTLLQTPAVRVWLSVLQAHEPLLHNIC